MKTESMTLYHYCKLSTAIELILPEKQLLLNPLGKTNDPRENKSFVFAASGMKLPDMVTLQNRNSDISQEIRRDCKMLCFSVDDGPYFGYELSRMWAMYGDNHKGICVALDKEKFVSENSGKITHDLFKRVRYVPLPVSRLEKHKQIDYDKIEDVGMETFIIEFRKANVDYLFFTKNAEWESEQEIRVVHFSDMKENEYCRISESLKAIYLGVDFNDKYLPAIRAFCNDIDIFKLEYVDVRLTDRLLR